MIVRRDSGTVVGDREYDGAIGLGEAEGDLGPGMPGGVVGEVVDHPGQRGLVAADLTRGDPGRADGQICC